MGKTTESLSVRVTVTTAATTCLLLTPLIYTITLYQVHSWKEAPSKCDGVVGETHVVAPVPVTIPSNGGINNGRSPEKNDSLKFLLASLLQGKDRTELEIIGFGCKSDPENDVCVTNQRVWMKSNLSALSVYLSSQSLLEMPRMVRPYVKKNDDVRRHVKEITIMPSNNTNNTCDVTHDIPAVVFSTGLVGNVFHELNEIILPLFLTCHHFRSRLQFVITDYNRIWVNKFRRILSHLSDYEIINASEDNRAHCFPGAVTGLHFHNDNLVCTNKDLPINCSMKDFREFLRQTFQLKIKNVAQLNYNSSSTTTSSNQDYKKRKPVLVLLSRPHSRKFLNEGEMVKVATELGFRVIVAKPDLTSNFDKFSRVVNRCHVLVGAHGAGLTNEVFLPEGAVLVQVVPLGVQWGATHYYGIPARGMGIQYLEYQISPQESSLFDVYGPNHTVITDPDSVHRQGYNVSGPIYVDGQDLRLNLSKFRDTLMQALALLGR